MKFNLKKVLGVAEKIIHVINKNLPDSEGERKNGKFHSDHNSNNSSRNKERKMTK